MNTHTASGQRTGFSTSTETSPCQLKSADDGSCGFCLRGCAQLLVCLNSPDTILAENHLSVLLRARAMVLTCAVTENYWKHNLGGLVNNLCVK